MKPRETKKSGVGDLFRERLENLIDLRHPLAKLSEVVDWAVFEEAFGALYDAEQGRPGVAVRLMVGLHYLKHAFDRSDEEVVLGWVENPYWQYVCGEAGSRIRTGSIFVARPIFNIGCRLILRR